MTGDRESAGSCPVLSEKLSREAQSRGENMMINRACEIFVDARKALGDDLSGQSLIDLIADNSGYSLDTCRELASIVVERCECSDRLRETYAEPDQASSRIVALARVAYQGYGTSTSYEAYNDKAMPAWDELPERIKRGWRGSVVELLLAYQAGTSGIADPGETVKNSEHHFAAGEISGISMRMVTPAGEQDQKPRMIIERDIHERDLTAGVERLSLNRGEAHSLAQYLVRIFSEKIWRK